MLSVPSMSPFVNLHLSKRPCVSQETLRQLPTKTMALRQELAVFFFSLSPFQAERIVFQTSVRVFVPC